MTETTPEFYAAPGPMTALADVAGLDAVTTDLAQLREVVQGLLLHRDWAPVYGVEGSAVRLDEQHLRSARDVLDRALEIVPAPITESRAPVDRVLGICRHFTLLHTALLRHLGVPARVRCGFGNYFDRAKWFDHWITERWNGTRWVRDDPQIDAQQAEIISLDFDPYDQPPGQFLSASEAWAAARAGRVDPDRFGIFDMWGIAYIRGNVVSDFACLNKVELLPWDAFGMIAGPDSPLGDEESAFLDHVADVANRDDFPAIRDTYLHDDRLRVPAEITSFQDGVAVDVHLDL